MRYTKRVLGPFLQAECTSADRRNYNFQLAWLRVRSEHTIGILMVRWASLKELRLGISSDKAFAHATDWVLVRCVLHIICVAVDDGAPDRVQEGVEPPVISQEIEDGADDTRPSVMERLCSFMRSRGSYHGSPRQGALCIWYGFKYI